MRDNSIIQLILLMAPLSLLTIGGGGAILAPLHDASVNTHGWMTSREFVDIFAIARTCPGPGSILVALIGWKVAGWPGAIIATISIFLPAATLCYFAAKAWNRYRGTLVHAVLERGLTPIGTGLSVAGAVQILHASQTGIHGWVIAAVGMGVVMWRNPHPLIILGLGGVLFVLLSGAGL
jgi:chromate transporter